MSGTYNAPDEATPITPLGRRASSVAGFRGRHGLCCVGRVGADDGREVDHPATQPLPERAPASPESSPGGHVACLGYGGVSTPPGTAEPATQSSTAHRSTLTARRSKGVRRCGSRLHGT